MINCPFVVFTSFTYHVSVVPTAYVDRNSKMILTSQFATTEFRKQYSEEQQQFVPGIFIKYDFEPILVRISEHTVSFLTFLIHVGAIIGGVWTCVRMGLNYARLITVKDVLERRKNSFLGENMK